MKTYLSKFQIIKDTFNKTRMKYFDIIIKVYATLILIISIGFKDKLPDSVQNYWWITFISVPVLFLIKRGLNKKKLNSHPITYYTDKIN